jgi:hypothetical protein
MWVRAKRNFSAGRFDGQLLSFEEGKKYEVTDAIFKKAPFGSFEKIEAPTEEVEEEESSEVNEPKKRGRKPKE